jgi:nucleoside 2-deoxyribosyltransferase
MRQVNENQKLIIQHVFNHFDKNGEWPYLLEFEVEYRKIGNIRDIIQVTGRELIYIENEHDKNTRINLTIEGIAICPNSSQLLNKFIVLLNLLVEAYCGDPRHPQVDTDTISKEIGQTDLNLKKIMQLLRNEHKIHRAISGIYPNEQIEISHQILDFEGVKSVSDYIERLHKRDRQTTIASIYQPEYLESNVTDSVRKFQLEYPDPRKVAFIMMQFDNTKLQNQIYSTITGELKNYNITGVRADTKSYSDELWENIKTYMVGCGFGIAVLERLQREEVNPNVSLEIGYMLGLHKPVCLLKDQTINKLQSDLVGKLYQDFDTQNPEETIPPLLMKWLTDKGFIK